MAIDVQAGFLRDPNGNKILQPLPFGPKARLILLYLCSRAIRQKAQQSKLRTLSRLSCGTWAFRTAAARKAPLTAFKEQLNALAACTIRISAWTGEPRTMKTFVPLEEVDLWLSNNPDQRSLWPSTVAFSQPMYESLQRHALPVNLKPSRLSQAPRASLTSITGWAGASTKIHALLLSWEALATQFGEGFTRPRAFRAQMALEVAHLKEVFPKLPLSLDERGMRIEPAAPEVLALPIPRAARRKG